MPIVNFIQGRIENPQSGKFRLNYAPATGEEIGEVADSNAADVEAAYKAAREAQPQWASMSVAERVERLRAWTADVLQEVDEISLMDARDSGIQRRTMRFGVTKGVAYFDYFCGIAYEMKGETIPVTAGNLHYTKREPYGVVGIIIPYNHPAMFVLSNSAPALVAGNSVVLKPSELTPTSALRIAELSQDYLPPGVFNIVQGGAEAGGAIVSHPDIWRIQFIGGVKTGLSILKGSAESGRVKKVTMELGGKNPLIIYPDVDAETAARAAVQGMNYTRNVGQSCGSTSRLFVHRAIAQDVTEAIIALVEEIQLGLPEDDDTEMGALVSREHQQRVLSYVSGGLDDGARLRIGGAQPEGELAAGAYVEPTVFDNVKPGMRIAIDEIFGPVLSVIDWDDEATMLQAVNQVQYGLTAAIYTNDISTAFRCADQVQAGYIWINGIEKRWVAMPFGGYKNSGIGVTHALEELLSYTRSKAVSVML